VWCPERGETIGDARLVGYDGGFSEVAEYYAKYLAGFNGDPFEQITLHVLNARDPEGYTRQVTVTVEVQPVFSAGSALLVSDLLALREKEADRG
jgi:hypothetical protein